MLGLRKGEVLGLGWDEVDLDEGELRVDWQLQRIRERLVRRRTKTETSDATLPLPDICVTAREQRDAQFLATVAAGTAWHDTGLVLGADARGPETTRRKPRLMTKTSRSGSRTRSWR